MPPHSNSDMGREQSAKNDPDIKEISEKFQKIALLETKTEDEHCTYTIDEDEDKDEDEEEEEDEDYSDSEDDSTTNTSELEDCATIKEKGAIKSEKHNNARTNPLSRNHTSGGHFSYNNNIENAQNNNFGANPEVPANSDVIAEQRQFSNFNYLQMLDLQPLLNENDDNEINEIINEIISENSDNDDHSLDAPLPQINDISLWSETPNNHPQLLTNPPIIKNIPQTSTNLAQQALSNHIDQNKKLKLDIWILVNTKCEDELISTLWDKTTSAHFVETDLNFIYTIIVRLMKTVDGKRLLVDYFSNDVIDSLFNIAIKGNVLLMDFILEVYQNLGINPGMFNVLHLIVEYSHVDLCEIFDGLLNKTFDYKPSLNIFNVNWADSVGQTILMIVLRNISMGKGLFEVNMKYLDVILRRIPDISYISRDGRNVFSYVYNCRCSEDIIRKFLNYYDPFIIDNLMKQTYNGWGLYFDTC